MFVYMRKREEHCSNVHSIIVSFLFLQFLNALDSIHSLVVFSVFDSFIVLFIVDSVLSLFLSLRSVREKRRNFVGYRFLCSVDSHSPSTPIHKGHSHHDYDQSGSNQSSS